MSESIAFDPTKPVFRQWSFIKEVGNKKKTSAFSLRSHVFPSRDYFSLYLYCTTIHADPTAWQKPFLTDLDLYIGGFFLKRR